jgi:hypothetical protein
MIFALDCQMVVVNLADGNELIVNVRGEAIFLAVTDLLHGAVASAGRTGNRSGVRWFNIRHSCRFPGEASISSQGLKNRINSLY